MVSDTQREERRHSGLARMAVNMFFFLNGVMNATFSTRLPAVQMKLALPAGQLGLALLGCTIGGLVAMNIAGRVSTRFGSKAITTFAALGAGIMLPLIALAPTLPLFLLALVLYGAASGAMEVTMNLQATEVERVYDRPIMNSFHSYFSVGSLAGAALGSLLAAYNVQPVPHFLAIAGVSWVILLWSSRFLYAAKREQIAQNQAVQRARSSHISPTLLLLGVIAFCSFLGVGAMFDWSALYLSGTLHTGAGVAAAGFATFLACMALGRSVGDALSIRFGAGVLVRIACLLAALGLTLALVIAWMPAVFLGLGLVGIGLSVPFPLVLSATGHLARQDKGSALATVTTWGYCGLIAGPPMIGFLADRLGMRLALASVALLCVLAALCASPVGETRLKEVEEKPRDCKPTTA